MALLLLSPVFLWFLSSFKVLIVWVFSVMPKLVTSLVPILPCFRGQSSYTGPQQISFLILRWHTQPVKPQTCSIFRVPFLLCVRLKSLPLKLFLWQVVPGCPHPCPVQHKTGELCSHKLVEWQDSNLQQQGSGAKHRNKCLIITKDWFSHPDLSSTR